MLRKRTSLGIESLESKRLLACDVAFDGEKLEIDCDDAGDLILISEVDGDLIAAGQNLGSAENLTDIEVKSAGGGDAIIMSNLDVAGNIELKTGGDVVADDDIDDVIIFLDVNVGGDVEMETGEGADYIFFSASANVAGSVEAKMSKGNDTVFALFGSLTADDIELNGEDGDDTITNVANLIAANELEIKNFENVS